MKKIFTLCLALLALSIVPVMAQNDDEEIDHTLEFLDEQGNVIADGSQLVRSGLFEDPFGVAQVQSGLYVRNTTRDDVFAAMEVNISRLDNGSFSCCFPGNCSQQNKSFTTEPDVVRGNIQKQSIVTEWLPASADSYGQAVVQLRIRMYATMFGKNPSAGAFIGYGPSVTVTFVNPDPTGIRNVNAENSKASVSAIYNVRGERVSKLQKGINLVRYADATTRKVLK